VKVISAVVIFLSVMVVNGAEQKGTFSKEEINEVIDLWKKLNEIIPNEINGFDGVKTRIGLINQRLSEPNLIPEEFMERINKGESIRPAGLHQYPPEYEELFKNIKNAQNERIRSHYQKLVVIRKELDNWLKNEKRTEREREALLYSMPFVVIDVYPYLFADVALTKEELKLKSDMLPGIIELVEDCIPGWDEIEHADIRIYFNEISVHLAVDKKPMIDPAKFIFKNTKISEYRSLDSTIFRGDLGELMEQAKKGEISAEFPQDMYDTIKAYCHLVQRDGGLHFKIDYKVSVEDSLLMIYLTQLYTKEVENCRVVEWFDEEIKARKTKEAKAKFVIPNVKRRPSLPPK